MKSLKVIIPVVVAALIVVWLVWLRTPSIRAVCENTYSIMSEEYGEEIDADLMNEGLDICVADFEEMIEEFPDEAPTNSELKCMASAKDMEALNECEVI